MLGLLLSILVIALVALGIWLWWWESARKRQSTANHQSATTLQPTTDSTGCTSPGQSVERETEESSPSAQGNRFLASGLTEMGPGRATTGSSEDPEQALSQVTVRGSQSDCGSIVEPEGRPEVVTEATQTRQHIADRHKEHNPDNHRETTGVGSDEPDEWSVAKIHNDAVLEESEDGTTKEESVIDEAHRTPEVKLSRDVGEVTDGEESDGDSEPARAEAATFHTVSIGERNPEATTCADSDAHDESGYKEVSTDVTIGGKARYGQPAAPSEGMANVDGPSEAKLSGDVRNVDVVGGEETSRSSAPADTEAPTSRVLSSREESPETDACANSAAENESDSGDILTPLGEEALRTRRRKKQPAVYRDRRGVRRAVNQESGVPAASPSPPAEARLRLLLDPVQRSANLSVVLMRPEGFPERIQPLLDGADPVEAFDTSRYDDLALAWTDDLLDGELRIQSEDGHEWLRTARAIHIFAEMPAEPGMMSVGSVRADVTHAIVCKTSDEEAVCAVAASTGSPRVVSHERWHGIPDGWAVLSVYRPRHAATPTLATQFRPLDPGTKLEISLSGGLAIRAAVYAEGKPPRIGIAALPEGASVMIDGIPAERVPDGAWEAPGWDSAGSHLIDVVPGPSLTYHIVADPFEDGGWQFWDAYPERFSQDALGPWADAEICGAAVRGPHEETVIAAVSEPILIALGERRHAVRLAPRGDMPASVAMVPESPAFLVAATGQRRKQGRIVWLGSLGKRASRCSPDQHWVETVRSIAARRLRLDSADTNGERAWQSAKKRARRVWRRR